MKTKDERLEFTYDNSRGLIDIYDSITNRCISMSPDEITQLCEYEQSLKHMEPLNEE